jgi:ketosteroid isomerase-like protein
MPEVPSVPMPSDVADPQRSVDELLAADRAFAKAAATTDLVTALSNMFVSNVVIQAPGGHVRGRDSVVAALSANADNRRSRVDWTPVRGGVSSDGRDGFTLGYMTITRPDGTIQPAKYVAYWVLRPAGWRVAAYKRVPRKAGEVSLALLPPSLPVRALPRGDSATVARYADELSLAEHAFSRDAGPMGLGPAFFKWGAPDAALTGGADAVEFVRGPAAIAASVSEGLTPGIVITWAPTQVIVASTGDLGVSIGTIRIATPAAAGRAAETREVPFFTIWKRAYPSDPWRYVAE